MKNIYIDKFKCKKSGLLFMLMLFLTVLGGKAQAQCDISQTFLPIDTPTTVGGVTVTRSATGNYINFIPTTPTTTDNCGSTYPRPPEGSIHLTPSNSAGGNGGTSSSVTYTFGQPVNDVVFRVTGMHASTAPGERITVTANAGTVTTTVSYSCGLIKSANTYISTTTVTTNNGDGALIMVSSTEPYTTFTISHSGSTLNAGAVIGLCEASIQAAPCPAGDTPPALTAATVTAGSVDLASMVTGTPPNGDTTVEWHTTATPVDDSTLLPGTTVTATTTLTNYYAVYHFDDGTYNCYSPTTKVTVVSNDCSADETTVDLTAIPTSALPADTEVVWYKDADKDNGGTLVTDPTAVGAGTYYPYIYDSTNDCYSDVGTPVVVGIENCSEPFDCNDNGNIYLVDAGGATQLYSIDYSTTPYTKQVIGDTSHGIQYHAIGYNRADNYIYALSVQNSVRKLYKIGSDGMPVELGTVTGLASGSNYIVGGIANGKMIVKQNNLTTDFEAIDLTDLSVTTIPAYGHNMGDVTYNEVDGKLYFTSRGQGTAGSPETGHLVSIDVATGTETILPYDNLALIGANTGGMLSTATGKVLAINNAGNVFRFNLVTGRATQVGTIDGIPGAYDAASCLADWILDACTQPGTAGTALTSSVGITTKGNPTVSDWPQSVPNGYLVLDSENKGMVITHMTTAQINALTPVEGMLVYDTTAGCVKLYRGTNPGVNPTVTGWVCIERICKE